MPPRNIQRQFWNRIEKADGCWPWLGNLTPKGYGYFRWFGRQVYAHRFSYEAHIGPLPADPQIFVCHQCDNPRCVNPAHLFLGDHLANMQDKARKDRAGALRPKPKGVGGYQQIPSTAE